MKTFKWTFPENPLSHWERERTQKELETQSGILSVIGGSATILLGLWLLFTPSFIKGVSTYFWESTQGTILSNDLKFGKSSGGGSVTYSVVINDTTVERTVHIHKNWSINPKAKFERWKERYNPGNSATIFYNQTRQTSLGRWESPPSSLGVGIIFWGFLQALTGIKQIRAIKTESAGLPREKRP